MKNLKILLGVLSLVLAILITGCSGKSPVETSEETASPSPEATQSATPTPSEEPQVPLVANPGSVEIGSTVVTAEWIKLPEPVFSPGANSGMTIIGDTLYLTIQGELVSAKIVDGALTYTKKVPINSSNMVLSADSNNTIYVSNGVLEPDLFDADLNPLGRGSVKGNIIMSENWGIAYWRDNDVQILTGTDAGATAAPWVLSNLKDDGRAGPFKMIDTISIMNDHVLVGGDIAETKDSRLVVYDKSGKEIMSTTRFKRAKPSILAEGNNGYISGTTGTLEFWDKNGGILAAPKEVIKDLFGVPSIWPSAIVREKDGSFLILCSAYPNQNQSELMLFRIKGF